MSEPTVRQRLKGLEDEARDPDLSPARASSMSMELASLLSSANAHVRSSELAYNRVRLDLRAQAKSAADATMRADVTPEWESWREAIDTREAILEMSRTMRKVLDTLTAEMRMTR